FIVFSFKNFKNCSNLSLLPESSYHSLASPLWKPPILLLKEHRWLLLPLGDNSRAVLNCLTPFIANLLKISSRLLLQGEAFLSLAECCFPIK
ncbi:MAG: hypothetical protein QXL51_05455, partial [Candidatus Aenigmatarchaeota archaeon]